MWELGFRRALERSAVMKVGVREARAEAGKLGRRAQAWPSAREIVAPRQLASWSR